ncbi:MAG: hypothetical protein LKG27_02730 [Clostridiaceae bacterium]|nr:hypothetical protein [Clostridiaceae bacterium]
MIKPISSTDFNTSFANGIQQNTTLNHTAPLPNDTVTIQNANQKDSTKKKKRNKIIAVTAGILATAGLVATAIFSRGRSLKPAKFEANIDFTRATSMEDAVAYAKKNFGIKNFELGEDLDLANWVNEGLTNINNRFKGKAHMPKKVFLDDAYFAENPHAAAYCNMSKDFIAINKKLIDTADNRLGDYINQGEKAYEKYKNTQAGSLYSFALGTLHLSKNNNGEWLQHSVKFLDESVQNEIFSMLVKRTEKPNEFTKFDALHTNQLIDDLIGSARTIQEKPLSCIEQMFKKPTVREFLEKQPSHKTIEEYRQLKPENQLQACVDLMELLNKNNIHVYSKATCRANSQFDFLYHEMGHLLHRKNTSLWDDIKGVLSKKTEKEFLANEEYQKIASQISWYAKKDPKEYVAECFNAIVSGRKLSDKQMELYRKFRGPEIDQFINN